MAEQLWHFLTQGNPEDVVAIENDTPVTRAMFTKRMSQCAAALKQAGIQPGERVALAFGNQSAFLISLLAVWQIGAVSVPVNLQWPEADIAYVLHHAGVRLVMVAQAIADKWNNPSLPVPVWVSNGQDGSWEQALQQTTEPLTALTERSADELAILMYTSGTTGKPKGVMLSEKNLTTNIDGINQVFHFGPQDVLLHALPLFHAFGLILALYGLKVGATILLVPRWTPTTLATALVQHPVTVLPLVPTLFSLLIQGLQGRKPQHLKYCISGGATLPAKLLMQVEHALGCAVLEGYGLTETSPVIAVNRPQSGSCPGSVGHLLPNVQVQFIDDNGEWLDIQPDGATPVGEICVKADSIMLGYYQQPEATEQTMTAEGWLKTGDLGHLDSEGRLYISGGRKKDLIIKAGENISPVRIESVLYQHPFVQEACVFGVEDNRAGEEIMAAVVVKNPTTERELKKHCLNHLPGSMVPKQIIMMEQLPKNATGKILKKEVLKAWEALQTVG